MRIHITVNVTSASFWRFFIYIYILYIYRHILKRTIIYITSLLHNSAPANMSLFFFSIHLYQTSDTHIHISERRETAPLDLWSAAISFLVYFFILFSRHILIEQWRRSEKSCANSWTQERQWRFLVFIILSICNVFLFYLFFVLSHSFFLSFLLACLLTFFCLQGTHIIDLF